MKIITDNATLLKYVPNVLATAQGEAALFDKVQPQLALAEEWVQDTFTGKAILENLAAETEAEYPLREATAMCIVCEALRRALPQLDLVLTPNGFGIVSNSNIAPASKERVERLAAKIAENRDAAIEQMLAALLQDTIWEKTEQAAFFRATLFPNVTICNKCGTHTDRWNAYLSLRPRLLAIEGEMARAFLSPELLNTLRLGEFPQIAAKVRTLVIARIQNIPPRFAEEAGIVQFIRNTSEAYELWASTEIGQRWEKPALFANKREAKGYWF